MIENLPLLIQFVIYIVSFVLGAFFLVKFCDIFVDNASIIAKKFKIPPIVIGLTVVAIGTSIPEFAVSISDSYGAYIGGTNANIAIGNVVGSNISNILIVISLGCFFTPLIIDKKNRSDFIVLLFVSLMLTLFCFVFGNGSIFGNHSIIFYEGVAFGILTILYFVYVVVKSKRNAIIEEQEEKDNEATTNDNILKNTVLILISIAFIAIGGELVVYGAKSSAMIVSDALSINRDLSEMLLGLTIVAVGTSLPEIVTTFIASKKGQNEIAIGNVVGSNILNVCFVLGTSGIIIPLSITYAALVDVVIMLVVTILFILFAFKGKLTRKHSYIFLSIYVAYVCYLIIRTLISA
jgi:cation:H+ antiporter